jgi:hypothetical protein
LAAGCCSGFWPVLILLLLFLLILFLILIFILLLLFFGPLRLRRWLCIDASLRRGYTAGIMKTMLRIFALGLAMMATLCLVRKAHAEPPVQPPTAGHVIVLDNERTLDGDIERVGEQYRIRRASGETWIPVSKDSWLCESFDDAYQLLRRRSNPDDPDEHIRLAQWCHQHDLKSHAVAEARLAIAIRPDSGDGKRMLALLERSTGGSTMVGPPAPSGTRENVTPLPPLDVEPESLTEFITHVQPILMNACASCHGSQHAGSFKLMRVSSDGIMSRKNTQQNLTAVLWHVNVQNPELSPVLTKARLAHGEQTTPPLNIKGQQALALQTFQDWIKDVLAKNPLLPQQLGGTAVVAEARPILITSKSSGEPVGEPPPQTVQEPRKGSASAEVKPTPPSVPPEPTDEFDAAIFNRQFHPVRK